MIDYRTGSHVGGVFVEAEITNGVNPLGKTDKLINARHKVTVHNLNLYSARFKCEGSIVNNPRNTKFRSPHHNDSDDKWTSHIKVLLEKESLSIDHVQIIPVCKGCDLIFAQVNIDWPHPGRSETIKLSINCRTNL